MSTYRRPLDPIALANNFEVFAAADCIGEPLYAALSHTVAASDRVLDLLMQAPYPQRRPVLLFAATHDLLLAGIDHPLARFYRSVTGDDGLRTDVANAGALFVDFCDVQHDALSTLLRERRTQTNEVGRCAGLRLALATIPSDRPIALVDVGCSAGLNLLVDRYRIQLHRPDGTTRAVGPSSRVVVDTVIGTGDPFACDPATIPAIAQRFGIDLAPLDVTNPRDARWLRACVWPSEADRHARLAAAIALVDPDDLDLRRGSATGLLAGIVAAIDPDVRPVLFHSWVLSYLDQADKQAFCAAVRALVVERDAVWISAEGPGVVPGLDPPPLAGDADAAHREATIWHVTRNVDGRAVARPIARSHPHCRWIDWLD